ncbi:hypothetical protein HanHA300_Chr06g0204581 [Helianthus annuus]|uniref:Uncharacterized protein n=1 Tax=Helianthus annuus TaxID=4232 RepID=A0A251UGI9_HELAN|nr:uncharacterized protein LOC110944485 [Helianthus annuus]KAJ0559816.1 hypothetical protein HanHA300_Chr06g0204581 [Helianthus annuus]
MALNGLPIGLLPEGVTDFEYDESGWFEVHLDQACNAKFEDELHYDQNVSGNMSYGQIGGLSGISAQDLFLWFPVKEIRVDVPSSGLIYFDVVLFQSSFRSQVLKYPWSVWRLRISLLLRMTVHLEQNCRSTASQQKSTVKLPVY